MEAGKQAAKRLDSVASEAPKSRSGKRPQHRRTRPAFAGAQLDRGVSVLDSLRKRCPRREIAASPPSSGSEAPESRR
jgi:hypothetical protein